MDSSSKTASSSVHHVSLLLVTFLAVIIVLSIASYCTFRVRLQGLRGDDDPTIEASSVPADVVIDKAVLQQFPKLVYSEAKHRFNEETFSCSVYLGDYGESDVLRLLPDCGHVFHLKCVDPWLRLRPTCPLCRSPPRVMNELDNLVTFPI